MGTTPNGIVYPDPSAVPSRQALVDLAESVDDALDSVTANVVAISPFASNATVTRLAGDWVVMDGSMNRPSGSSTAFVDAGTIPAGFRPATTFITPRLGIGLLGASFQVRVDTAGVLSIRMSGDDSQSMYMTTLGWKAA